MGAGRRFPLRTGLGPLVTTAVLVSSLTFAATLGVAASAVAPRPMPGVLRVGSGTEAATITRDSYGVPTITAANMAGVWFGAGYAQAQDRMAQLELVRRTVEGTLSGLAGSSQLAQDEDIRTFFYTPAELEVQLRSLPPASRGALQQFADGINAYENLAFATPAKEHALVPYEFHLLGILLGLKGPYRPSPWRAIDTVAVGDYLAREFGGGGGSELSNLMYLRYLKAYLTSRHDAHASADATAIFDDTRWLDDPSAPTTVPSAPFPAASDGGRRTGREIVATGPSLTALRSVSNADVLAAAAKLRDDRQLILRTGISLRVPSHDGSDAFVVAPRRSKDHHALLWGAPQEGFGTPSIDGEEYLHGPGYDAGGMDITGEPFILIGRNKQAAWTTTSEELVDQRVYSEKVRLSASPPSYWYDGKWTPLQVIHESIPVEGSSPRSYTVYRTVDGPLFYTDPHTGVAFAMRFASWGRETGSLEGFSELGGDTTLAAFTRSMRRITTLHNFLYADRAGNIAYFGDGLVPVEPSFAKVDPRLPAVGNGSEQWLGDVPWSKMPRSIDPSQGFLDNWNTKPSASQYYQQNSGDEYWGTIYRSSRITAMLKASSSVTIAYLEKIEHDIGQIDNGDNTRPAAPYFIPIIEHAYSVLESRHDPLVNAATHPDLAPAMKLLAAWNGTTTLGSPAMSIFMNTLEALERNVCEGGLNANERYVGTIDMSDSALKMGTYGGLGGDCTYNFLYHALVRLPGVQPCNGICYAGSYFAGHTDQILVESVNDAIAILSGTGQQLGQAVPGFGTTDVANWGYRPAIDENWDSLDPAAYGFPATHCGSSATQNRSTFMMAVDVGPTSVTGVDVLPPGQSGFLGQDGKASPHLCDQVKLFDSFRYKAMPAS